MRADRLCLLDEDELQRARGCALRSQIERELERMGRCQVEDRWEPCPLERG